MSREIEDQLVDWSFESHTMHGSKRKTATSMASSAVTNHLRKKAHVSCPLPDEMVMEVLLRLPAKSILRFWAVCRSWAALFSTDEFCSLHMATPKAAPPKILYVSPTARPDSTAVYSSTPSEHDQLLFTIDSACGNSMQLVTPAPCHGLTLLFDAVAPAYYICNAATRAVTRLPPFRHVFRCTSAGLGFDARTRTHKVVRLIRGARHDDEFIRCEVHTHGGDRWRPVGIPFRLCRFASDAVINAALFNLPPVFANGSLHWLVQPNLFTKKRPRAAVVSFSLAEETFSSVGPPPFWSPEMYPRTPSLPSIFAGFASLPGTVGEHLVQMDDQLCMVRDLRSDLNGGCVFEIWKVPDSSAGSWSLNHRIDLFSRVARDLRQPQVVRVIGSTSTCNGGRSGNKLIIATSQHRIFDEFLNKVQTYDLSSQSVETISFHHRDAQIRSRNEDDS